MSDLDDLPEIEIEPPNLGAIINHPEYGILRWDGTAWKKWADDSIADVESNEQ